MTWVQILLFLVLYLALVNIKEVNSGDVKEIVVPGSWRKIYDKLNYTPYPIEITSSYTYGMRSLKKDDKTVEVKHSTQAGISTGDIIKVVQLTFSYSYEHTETIHSSVEVEIQTEQTYTSKYTIPPWQRFTRWQFVVDIVGNDYRYQQTFDTLNNTIPPGPSLIKATVELRKQIQIGSTQFRLKHKVQNRYMTIQSRLLKPAATLGKSTLYNFILYKTGDSYKVKSLKTTKSGHDLLYADVIGDVFLDKNQERSRFKYLRERQKWTISKPEPLHDGDAISFKNKEYGKCFLSYANKWAISTEVFCRAKQEDEWILEMV